MQVKLKKEDFQAMAAHAVAHLPEEACVLRVAVVVVGAAQAHGRLELEVGRLARGDELLFLLQHGKQHFLADAA